MNELVKTLAGNPLSLDEAPPDRAVREISVEMLPLQHSGHLVNSADRFGAGWFDSQNNQLRLQFHLVPIFSNAKTGEIWLSVPGQDERIALSPTCIASPVAAQRYPELSWSAHSRFVVDEVVELPDGAMSSARFDLWAEVAGKPENIGVVYVGEVSGSQRELNTSKAVATEIGIVATPTSVMVTANSAVTAVVESPAAGALLFDNGIPIFTRGMINRIKGMNRLFLFTVALPTFLSVIYFGLIASDIYVSESRFVVRSPQRQASIGLGALFQGAGFSRSQDDTYTVHDYIFSRDALKKLNDQFALDRAFASSNVDIFSRFAGLDWDNSFEALHRYYQKRVTVDMDSLSSIATLSVNAFAPEDAYQLNERLLELSEELVNQLNERGRQDMIRFASAEVAIAEKKAKEAALAVSSYRNLKGVFDPEKQSALQLQQVSRLQDELIATKMQLAQVRALTRDNPQVPTLQQRIQTLQTEIDLETAKVAGSNRSLSNKSAEYEGLIVERGFAEKQLAAALTSLAQARNDAQRKQLYLERIAQPSKPDVAIEPRRIRNVIATFVLGLVAWGILTMLLAGVREHQD